MALVAPVVVAPWWAPGQFQILFLSMGQGDCCIITCPDGAHIMIDCGSKALEDADALIDLQRVIRSVDVLALPNSLQDHLEALILTHPDTDHISKVTEIIDGDSYTVNGVVEAFAAIPVNKVYFSDCDPGRIDFAHSPLRWYGVNDCSTTLYNYAGVQEMYCVTLRNGAQILDKWTPPFNHTKHADDSATIANDRVTIRSGVVAATGDAWEVAIIAGNVTREAGDKSDGDGRNAASLVTLVTLGNDKALICGDATQSTENYLYAKYHNAADIKDVNLLQAPHHGSGVTSSTDNFVNLTSPRQVVISVQRWEHSHHLPGAVPMSRYIAKAAAHANHPTNYWYKPLVATFNQAKNAWIDGKAKGNVAYYEEYDNQARVARYVLMNADDNFRGPIILDGFQQGQSKYMLFQRPLNKDIKQTGLNGHLWYNFP